MDVDSNNVQQVNSSRDDQQTITSPYFKPYVSCASQDNTWQNAREYDQNNVNKSSVVFKGNATKPKRFYEHSVLCDSDLAVINNFTVPKQLCFSYNYTAYNLYKPETPDLIFSLMDYNARASISNPEHDIPNVKIDNFLYQVMAKAYYEKDYQLLAVMLGLEKCPAIIRNHMALLINAMHCSGSNVCHNFYKNLDAPWGFIPTDQIHDASKDIVETLIQDIRQFKTSDVHLLALKTNMLHILEGRADQLTVRSIKQNTRVLVELPVFYDNFTKLRLEQYNIKGGFRYAVSEMLLFLSLEDVFPLFLTTLAENWLSSKLLETLIDHCLLFAAPEVQQMCEDSNDEQLSSAVYGLLNFAKYLQKNEDEQAVNIVMKCYMNYDKINKEFFASLGRLCYTYNQEWAIALTDWDTMQFKTPDAVSPNGFFWQDGNMDILLQTLGSKQTDIVLSSRTPDDYVIELNTLPFRLNCVQQEEQTWSTRILACW